MIIRNKQKKLDTMSIRYFATNRNRLANKVTETHCFYSRFDSALRASEIEHGAKDVVRKFIPWPDKEHEPRLGHVNKPDGSPTTFNSYNATLFSNREINHSDYMDSKPILETIVSIFCERIT